MTPTEAGLSALEATRAQTAINRLQAQGRVAGRFPRVSRAAATEGTFTTEVHTHDGPLGNGRTIIVDVQRGDLLIRRTIGEGSHGVTSDGWKVIDLASLLKA